MDLENLNHIRCAIIAISSARAVIEHTAGDDQELKDIDEQLGKILVALISRIPPWESLAG